MTSLPRYAARIAEFAACPYVIFAERPGDVAAEFAARNLPHTVTPHTPQSFAYPTAIFDPHENVYEGIGALCMGLRSVVAPLEVEAARGEPVARGRRSPVRVTQVEGALLLDCGELLQLQNDPWRAVVLFGAESSPFAWKEVQHDVHSEDRTVVITVMLGQEPQVFVECPDNDAIGLA